MGGLVKQTRFAEQFQYYFDVRIINVNGVYKERKRKIISVLFCGVNDRFKHLKRK